MRLLCLFSVVCLAPLQGCARKPALERTLQRYQQALQNGDEPTLWRTLAPEARPLTRAEHRSQLKDNSDEVAEISEAMREKKKTVRSAVVATESGLYRLERENGGWKIVSGPFVPKLAATPEEALMRFRETLLTTSESMLTSLSEQTAELFRAQRERLIGALAHPELLTIKVDGDQAIVFTAAGDKIVLRREEGIWAVYDVL